MIQQFEVKDFKCHIDNNMFVFPGMTIVSGTNNSGKSSLLQAVYLLTQNATSKFPVLDLNRNLKLGSFTDILNKDKKNDDSIELGVKFEQSLLKRLGLEGLFVNFIYKNPALFKSVPLDYFEENPILYRMEISYRVTEELESYMEFEFIDKSENGMYEVKGDADHGFCNVNGIVPESIIYSDLNKEVRKISSVDFEKVRTCLLLLSMENIKYLRAFRLDDYKQENYSVSRDMGISGEYTAEIIHSKWDNVTDFSKDEHSDWKFSSLFDGTIRRFFGDNYQVKSEKIEKGKYKIIVRETDSGLELPLNQVGFGISQLLPIITIILTSKKRDIILIENPEVHLHPKLQSIFIDFCIFAVENHRKLVIETHSEHIINRLRMRIKENSELVSKVNVYFFEKESGVVKNTEVGITIEGKIERWPKNFFDQSYNDLLGLID